MANDPIRKFSVNDDRLWHYRAYVQRVVDGDTVVAALDRGFRHYAVERLRLQGIDAPELAPRKGSSAQRKEERALGIKAKERLIELIEGREIIVRTHKTGKFGRWLATLLLVHEDGTTQNVNEILLQEGHAVRYGEPRPWRAEG